MHDRIVTTPPVTLLGLGGSTRRDSRNGMALRIALQRAALLGATTELFDLHTCQFPLLDRDRPLQEYPADVARYLDAVRKADGFILGSPTYHGSMSGAFKNALDLLIYGGDDDFGTKPVGIMALGGANGTPVLDMMTTTVHALHGLVVPTRVLVPHGVVTGEGTIAHPAVTTRIDRMVQEVIHLASVLRRPVQVTAMRDVAPVPSFR